MFRKGELVGTLTTTLPEGVGLGTPACPAQAEDLAGALSVPMNAATSLAFTPPVV